MGLARPRGHTQLFAVDGATWRPTDLGPRILGPSESSPVVCVSGGAADDSPCFGRLEQEKEEGEVVLPCEEDKLGLKAWPRGQF